MARRTQGFQPRRRLFRRRRLTRWTADAFTGVQSVASGAAVTASLVTPADYEQNTTMEAKGATLLRIRGSVSLIATVALSNVLVTVSVVVIDNDEPTPDFDVPTAAGLVSLIRESVLWTRTYMLQRSNAGTPVFPPLNIELDVLAKRRLDDQVVMLIIDNSSTSTGNVECYAVARALLGGAF